ncbi:Protein PHLOEM PROTEIN 2-LIKE A5 [Linum perenne]
MSKPLLSIFIISYKTRHLNFQTKMGLIQEHNTHISSRSSSPHWKPSDGGYSLIFRDPNLAGAYRIPARALSVIWGNDPRYWQWIQPSDRDKRESGFKDVGAMLVQVNWIQVSGRVPMSWFVGRRYEIVWVVKFRVDAFGWHSVPIKFKVRQGNGEEKVKSVVLEPYRKKHDVWHEISGGEFTVAGRGGGVVEFGMYEVDSEWWKGSMVIAGVKIKLKA